MSRKIRYGIAGFGRFAEKAIGPAIMQSCNSTLVAIQNRSLAKARSVADNLGVGLAFDSVGAMVAHPDVDAVFIVSANALHCVETLLVAEARKHVLCEKPMARTVAECQQMIDACKRSRVKLMVGHMVRFSPLIRRMRELVTSGAVGRVVRAESDFVYDGRLSSRAWLLDRSVAGGGPTFDVGVHCIDTLRYILDDEVVGVRSELSPEPDTDRTESSSQLLLRFARGAIGTVFSSYEAPLRESRVSVLGTEARITTLDFTVGGRTSELRIERRGSSGPPEVAVEQIEVPNLYIEEVDAFSACILDNTDPPLDTADALGNQRILDLAFSHIGNHP